MPQSQAAVMMHDFVTIQVLKTWFIACIWCAVGGTVLLKMVSASVAVFVIYEIVVGVYSSVDSRTSGYHFRVDF